MNGLSELGCGKTCLEGIFRVCLMGILGLLFEDGAVFIFSCIYRSNLERENECILLERDVISIETLINDD